MIRKVIYSVLFNISLIIALLAPSLVNAQDVTLKSQMIVLEVKNQSAQNGVVSAAINISNNSNSNFAQAYLVTKLVSPAEIKTLNANGQSVSINQPGQLVAVDKSDSFALKPGDKVDQSITLKYPTTVKSGTYTLTAEIKDVDGTSHGVSSGQITISGSGKFLDINSGSCQIKVANRTYGLSEGPSVAKNETGSVTCSVKNNTTQSIKAKTQAIYAINSVGDTSNPATINGTAPLTISAGQTVTASLPIPNDITPQVYEGLFYLVDESNQQISPHIPFRWIITGASASIKNIDLDKSYYPQGSTAKVSFQALPSVDLVWRGPASQQLGYSPNAGSDLVDAKITFKITNSDNKVCGQNEQPLPSTKDEVYWKDQVIDVPISIECKNPKVDAAIYQAGNDQPLATLTKGVVTTNSDLYSPASAGSLVKNALTNRWTWLIIGLILILGVIGGFLVWKKRKKTPPPTNHPTPTPPPATGNPSSAVKVGVLIGIFLSIAFGAYISKGSLAGVASFVVHAQQFSLIQGLEKPPVNSTDSETKTVTMKKWFFHDLSTIMSGNELPPWALTTYVPQWANVRDFAQNNTGGDSQVSVSDDCTEINVTVNGTVGSDYMCGNWGPGIAIANFVDDTAMTPTDMSSAINNQIIIPSLQIGQTNPTQQYIDWGEPVYNDFSTYGPHILNVYDLGVASPKSVSYKLKIPAGLSAGTHTLTLQAGTSLLTSHDNKFDRFYSSLENITPATDTKTVLGQPGDFNCDGKSPCYIPLKYTFTCKAPPACSSSCSTDNDCARAQNGCVQCRPNPEGQNVCQPPPPACGAGCTSDRECFGNKDGCSACVPSANGGGNVCAPPPACGTSCTDDKQCAGAKDGCVQCAANDAGKNVCQPEFNDAMCKCDGFNALNLKSPSDGKFEFEAFGKVEGDDVSKAKIQNMKFTLYKSTKADPNHATAVASGTIVPQIVSSSDGKVRYRAVWDVTPPAYEAGAIYRVGAEPSCVRQSASASASLNFSSNTIVLNSDNSDVLGMDYTPVTLTQDGGLELDTLKDAYFTRIVDTDSCRFIRFEYGQY